MSTPSHPVLERASSGCAAPDYKNKIFRPNGSRASPNQPHIPPARVAIRPRSRVTITIPIWHRSMPSHYLNSSKSTSPYVRQARWSTWFVQWPALPRTEPRSERQQIHKPTHNTCNTRVHTATLTITSPSTTPSQFTADSTNAGNAASDSEGGKGQIPINTFSRTHTVQEKRRFVTTINISC